MRKSYLYSVWVVLLALCGVMPAYATKKLKVSTNSNDTKVLSTHLTGGRQYANYPCLFCGEDYNVKGLSFQVTIQNTGDEAFAVGDEGYTVTLFLYTPKTDLITMPIPEGLEPGESKAFVFNWGGEEGFSFQPCADQGLFSNGKLMPNQYLDYCNLAVRENVTNTEQYRVGNPFYIYANESHFDILPETGVVPVSGNQGFGVSTDAKTMKFRLHSVASKDVVINSISLPVGFSTTVATPVTITGGTNATTDEDTYLELPITFNPETPGTYSGNVSILMEGSEEAQTFAVSAGKFGGDIFYTGFEGEDPTPGWILGNYQAVSAKASNLNPTEDDAMMLEHNNSTLANISKAITPKLHFNEGEKMLFDGRSRTGSGNGIPTIKVYYSADRVNWESAGVIIYCNNTAQANLEATDIFNTTSPYPFKQYSVQIPEGDYYVGFEMGNSCIDNVIGGTLVDVPYDLYLSSYTAPESMMVNKGGYFTMSVKNILGTKGLRQEEYKVSLFVDDKEVATAESIDWGPGVTMDFNMVHVPHTSGEIKAYMLLKAGEDYEVKSPEFTINVAEEVLVSDVTVGTPVANINTNNDRVPFNFYYNNSCSDLILPADYLAKYGITPGTVLGSMSIVGYCQNAKEINNTLSIQVMPTDATSLTISDVFDYTAATTLVSATSYNFPTSSSSNLVNVVDYTFAEPYIYEGGNLLFHFVTENGSSYSRTYYQNSTELTANARGKWNDNYNTYTNGAYIMHNNVPVITFGLVVSPATISGKVTNDGHPVGGATVTLQGENDVIYSAISDEEGNYTATIFQADKAYDMTVAADGLAMYRSSEPVAFENGSVVLDIEMHEYAIISGNVSSVVNGAVAEAQVSYICGDYSTSVLTDAEGNYSLNAYQFAAEAVMNVDASDYVYESKTIDMSVPQNMVVDFNEMTSFSNNRDYTLTIKVAAVIDVNLENQPFTLKSIRFNETYPASVTKLDANGECVINVYGGAQKLVIKTVGTEEKTVEFNVNRDRELNVLLGEDVKNPTNISTVLIHDAISGKNDLLVTWNPDEASAKPLRRVIHRSVRNPYESFIITMDGTKVGETEEYEYVIENVSGGTHMITVTAKYATTQSDAVTAVSEITNDNYVPVVVNVANNANADLDGVAVNFHGEENYAVSLKDGRAIIGYLPKGNYEVSLNLYGFEPYTQVFDFDEPSFVDINLTEIISKPYNLTAEAVEDIENNCFTVTADWNQVFGMSDSFEAYDDFATEFGDWKVIDNDTEPSYPMMWGSKLVTFPGSSTVATPTVVAPTIFNPESTEPSMAGEASVSAFDGKKSVIFQGPQASVADKWIISPAVDIKTGFECSFAARAYSQYSEALEVCVSTVGDAPEDFTVLEKISPDNTEWTVYTEDLSAYAGKKVRIAIHCVSEDGFMVQVDDFKVYDPNSEVAVDMGNILNYEVSIADLQETTTDTHCILEGVPAGNYLLGVKAIYASGASEQATFALNMVSGITGIATSDCVGDVVTPSGLVVLRNATLEEVRSLEKGIYIVNGRKVVVK